MLLYETRGTAKFYYSYDANGVLYLVSYTSNDNAVPEVYYYTHNMFGDIVGIYDSLGSLVAQYEYDFWGNIVSIKNAGGGDITKANHIANLNPFRYRGYYYDTESGLYYLISRYYDPVTHRFINSDGYFQAGNGILDANMHAYCGNNPIMFSDPSGLCYVDKKTSAGTYIGSYWTIKTTVPGFCNYCKSYRPGTTNNYYAGTKKNSNTKGGNNWSPRKDSKKGSEDRQKTGLR